MNKWNIVFTTNIRILYLILLKLKKYFKVSWLYQAFKKINRYYKSYNNSW